jgi:transglutaminase-like putative cysteine protease
VGSEARARLGLAGLLFITLLAFAQVFHGGDYQGPALLGAILAGCLSLGARRLGLGTAAAAALSLVALACYLAVVFEAEATYYGLPTAEALRGLVLEVGSAVRHSNTDFAPVPLRPGYVALVVAALWLTTWFAETATFHWSRSLLASLPIVALFALALIFGTRLAAPFYVTLWLAALLTYWGLESSHRLRSWGRWVPTWAHHGGEPPASLTGPLARKMGAGCLAAALVSPLLLPSIGGGVLSWRNDTGAGPATGIGGGIDPLVSIAPQLLQQSKDVLFTARVSQPTQWRGVTLGRFDGSSWDPVEGEEQPVESDSVPGPVPARGVRRESQRIELRGLGGDYLPAPLNPTSVRFIGLDASSSLRVNPESGDLRVEGGVVGGLRYVVTSSAPDVTYQDLAVATVGNPGDVYLQAPELSEPVRALLVRWTEGTTSPFTRLVAIQEHLRRFDYRLPSPQQIYGGQLASTDLLTDFLISKRAGYCQQFATAFALLGRSLGYPTRVVVGFLPGKRVSGGETYRVRGTDAHSWPEVYFQGHGWIPFEPTPRSDVPATPPSYTAPLIGGAFGGGPATGAAAAGAGAAAAQARLRGLGERVSPADAGGGPAGLRRARAGASEDRPLSTWRVAFIRMVSLLGVAIAILFALVPLLKLWRSHRRYAAARDPRARTVAAWRDWEEDAGELFAPRFPSESAHEYARRLGAAARLSAREPLRLAGLYEAAEYGHHAVDDEIATEARRLSASLKAGVWRSSSWWKRGARLFSPAPLVRRA